jgi:hypothetical protein
VTHLSRQAPASHPSPSVMRSLAPTLRTFGVWAVAFGCTAGSAWGRQTLPPPATPGATPGATPPAAPAAEPRTDDPTSAELQAVRAELEAAKVRIEELEAELAALRASMTEASGESTSATGANTDAHTDSRTDASNDSPTRISSITEFLSKAKAEYATAFPAPEAGQAAEAPAARKRSLERFVASMNRGWKQEVQWLMHINKVERQGKTATLTIQPLNDDGSNRGEAVTMVVEERRMRRLDVVLGKAQPNETYFVRALFTPRLTVNMDRQDEGMFNNPPLVGPSVELRYELNLEGISPFRPKADTKRTPTKTPADASR